MNVKKIPIPKSDWSKIEEVMADLFQKGYNRFEIILPYSEEHKRYGLSENVVLLKAWRIHVEV
jgi:hypothetical protein